MCLTTHLLLLCCLCCHFAAGMLAITEVLVAHERLVRHYPAMGRMTTIHLIHRNNTRAEAGPFCMSRLAGSPSEDRVAAAESRAVAARAQAAMLVEAVEDRAQEVRAATRTSGVSVFCVTKFQLNGAYLVSAIGHASSNRATYKSMLNSHTSHLLHLPLVHEPQSDRADTVAEILRVPTCDHLRWGLPATCT